MACGTIVVGASVTTRCQWGIVRWLQFYPDGLKQEFGVFQGSTRCARYTYFVFDVAQTFEYRVFMVLGDEKGWVVGFCGVVAVVFAKLHMACLQLFQCHRVIVCIANTRRRVVSNSRWAVERHCCQFGSNRSDKSGNTAVSCNFRGNLSRHGWIVRIMLPMCNCRIHCCGRTQATRDWKIVHWRRHTQCPWCSRCPSHRICSARTRTLSVWSAPSFWKAVSNNSIVSRLNDDSVG